MCEVKCNSCLRWSDNFPGAVLIARVQIWKGWASQSAIGLLNDTATCILTLLSIRVKLETEFTATLVGSCGGQIDNLFYAHVYPINFNSKTPFLCLSLSLSIHLPYQTEPYPVRNNSFTGRRRILFNYHHH